MSKPLSVKYTDALQLVEKLDSLHLRRDSPEYKAQLENVLDALNSIKKSIQQMALFSVNEDIDEVSTGDLRYLALDFYIAQVLGNTVANRASSLKTCNGLYLQFLYTLENYGILDKEQRAKLDAIKASYDPQIDELRSKDPVTRRQSKINEFKMEKEFKEKLKILESSDFHNLDDEVVRQIYLDQLKFFALKSFQSIESNLMEIELLHNMPARPIQPAQEPDERERQKKFDETYTDKVESLTNPILSKDGKVLRPFTIVPSRDQLQKKVFGTGQVLPTMTVEELVEQELANGGMVKESLPEKEFDEDNEEDVDRLTYKNREWDEFTDNNPRGSGNTQNLG
ncbi:hypothetical protein KL932_001007 [Ogataea haglerorum]|uniref:Uncharacterized protein n=1 Tax=Ogataea haglerorum TaxID=1937702 RepID=A0ABQ7RK99_9ASCO|nr:uncharacterized protein KL911_001701 [Ogataea haglerorum]KAG7708320.1 hypothetical protein KL914_002046 [Ogataea haglerorum]KAG7710653.1 hypothetical protein KL950_001566 [Ogataea haglerorum]KAG7744491.1 hypothetical protein KL932_001007 [Ogataea haglerorum]KAG7755644.1 hypothetical protein KL911_001701 [Ogataea haglerorum]KAG7767355.1 hypothetical protein KL946_001454 [Ogataea haglerorum]